MKQLHYLLLILLPVTSYPMEKITPEQRAAFEKKYPLLTDIYETEKQRFDSDNKELEQENAYILQQAQTLHRTVNTRIAVKIEKTESGIKLAASALPGFTVASAAIVSLVRSFDPEKIKNGTLLGALSVATMLIQHQRAKDPEFLSTTISGLGITTSLDLNIILGALGMHIYEHGTCISKDNFLHMAAFIGGSHAAYFTKKTESNAVINLPGTNYIALRDNQMVNIGCRTAGNLIAKYEKPTHNEILYELLKNTAGELSYNTIAQIAHFCSSNKIFKYMLPSDCNPNRLEQKLVKIAVVEGTARLICAIAPLIANSSIFNTVCNQATSVITSCMQPLLPM